MDSSAYFKPENVLAQELDDELVLLHLDSELYIALDPVAKRFWTLALSEGSLTTILESLESEYETTRERLQKDFEAFIQELEEHDLIAKVNTAK